MAVNAKRILPQKTEQNLTKMFAMLPGLLLTAEALWDNAITSQKRRDDWRTHELWEAGRDVASAAHELEQAIGRFKVAADSLEGETTGC